MAIPAYQRPALPRFDRPPVVEVSVGVQFEPQPALRSFEIGGLRETWRDQYPVVEEQPPLPPAIELEPGAFPNFQVFVGPQSTRLWFISPDRASLVQLQPDRLHFNWRESEGSSDGYPEWDQVREVFVARLVETLEWVAGTSGGPPPPITQVEITYINAIQKDGQPGTLADALRGWPSGGEHHLGQPQEARASMVFDVAGIGRPPVRLYAEAGPGRRLDGRPTTFLTLTVRGAPAENNLESAVTLADQGHDHIVSSFDELTPLAMHEYWGKRQ